MKIVGIPQSVYPESSGCVKTASLVLKRLKQEQVNEQGRKVDVITNVVELSGDFSLDYENITKQAKNKQEFTAFIGGDQSITYPLIKGFAEGKHNPGVILFDAHADCNPAYKTPLYNDVIAALIENRIIKPQNILVVGLRALTSQEHNYLRMHKIKTYSMKQISHEGLSNVCDALMSNAKIFSDLYISIDMDVVDPAFAPGVSVAEPGGLSGRELLYMIQRLRFLKNWKAAEVVEINPEMDLNEMTVALGAKIVSEFPQ